MKRKRERPLPEGDDGRTIASMNVEGMPWYTPDAAAQGREKPSGESAARPRPAPLTRREAREYTFGALRAALLVTGVMCLGLVLFILFCQFVWFRA